MSVTFTHRILFRCCLIIVLFGTACNTIQLTDKIPVDTYRINSTQYSQFDKNNTYRIEHSAIKVNIEQTDSILKIVPVSEQLKPFDIKLTDISQIKLYRNTFDVDVLTVPFKIRPSVNGFPQQLDANFDAALYLGYRHDNYTIKKSKTNVLKPKITGVGYGYGGFLGVGSVTMNSYVTQDAINYEYSGLVFNGGFAGIYDAKKFNVGLALGTDFLLDKNKHNWIYQGKPWLGILFGINLN